ncbi:MAG: polysaccharide deacetylase [Candidatus Bathyarchaeum sp.]|nr:MAG: polysaccharide deacetylase [Candidatus Bathyarchaeum sp.]
MKLVYAATISTLLVILFGILIISPMYLQPHTEKKQPQLMLSFSIVESNPVNVWCQDLAAILANHSVAATVFFVGNVAEQNPECVTIFGNNVDIGSQTYSNIDLTSISDYDTLLEEIRKGKNSVDNAGNLDSKSFRAPLGATDQNIYSLLSRNGILADFSYENQYNIFQNGQFIKIDIESYNWPEIPSDLLSGNYEYSKPIILYLDNSVPTFEIENLVTKLELSDLEIVSASQLAGTELTIRGDSQ